MIWAKTRMEGRSVKDVKRVSKDKKIVLTGGAGFIGSHIFDLLYKDNNVTTIDNLSAGRLDNLPERTNINICDMSRPEDWDHMIPYTLKDADVVIDCAAQVSTFESMTNPRKDFQINGWGKMMLLDTLRRVNDNALLIYTSSRSVHGDIPEPWAANEEFPFKAHSFYNLDKFYIEEAIRLYGKTYGMKYVILRPANVYGPRMTNKGLYGFMCRWIAYALQDKPIPIWGKGDQIRDFTYVTDIVKAYPIVIDNSRALGNEFLLCCGVETKLLELANRIFNKLGKEPKLEFYPPKKGDIQRFVGNFIKAEKVLNWSPKVGLEEGLDITIDWVKKNLSRYQEYNLT